MAVGKDYNLIAPKTITVTKSVLGEMTGVQSFMIDMLKNKADFSIPENETPSYTRKLEGFSGTALRNVCQTSSASTIAKNLTKVRSENRNLAYEIAQELTDKTNPANVAVVNIWDKADRLGATHITLTLSYLRVWESAQRATLFTLYNGATARSYTLPDGTQITA